MSELRTTGDPIAVEQSLVLSVLHDLGIKADDVAQVLIKSDQIIVTRYRRNADGHMIGVGDSVATESTFIAIRRAAS